MFHLEPKYQSATTSLPLFQEKFFKKKTLFQQFFLKNYRFSNKILYILLYINILFHYITLFSDNK